MLTTHTHQLAKKSRLLPSSPRVLVPCCSSQGLGVDRLRDPWGWEDAKSSVDRERSPVSSCLA